MFLLNTVGTRDFKLAAFALVAACAASSLAGQTTDLPYESPSTGVDGALVIPDTLPLWHDWSNPAQVVWDAQNDRLLAVGGALGRDSDLRTVGFVDGQWVDLDSNLALGNRDREQVALVYDAGEQRVLRFGGYRSDFADRYEDRLYRWTDEGWDLISVDDRPPERGLTTLVYDAAGGEVLLFGGENDDGELGDTWTLSGDTWTEKTPANSPSPRFSAAMAYDAARQEVVLFGGDDGRWQNDTWVWDGSEWTEKSPSSVPPDESPAMAYDPNRSVVVLMVGNQSSGEMEVWEWDGADWTLRPASPAPEYREHHGVVYVPDTGAVHLYNGHYENDSSLLADSWQWDGADWTRTAVSPYVFDMSEKPDGIWHYTSIDIGRTVVEFEPNAANTPVVWLASEDVIVEGHISLDGEDGFIDDESQVDTPARGGPGGYAGGLGGYYVAADGDNGPGFAGLGPGGGGGTSLEAQSDEWDGFHGQFNQTYGSESSQALVGGSGGGGGRTVSYNEFSEWGRGGNGGGGGGALLLASSGDIFLTGRITALGGEGGLARYQQNDSSFLRTGSTRGGSGSGGAIRLVADRVLGNGILDTRINVAFRHDHDDGPESRGRSRVEAYFHEVRTLGNAGTSFAFPRPTLLGADAPQLRIDRIAGQNVSVQPSSAPAAPEVVFSNDGPVTVEVVGQNLPDGTLVNLRVTSNSEIIEPASVALSGGSASFSVSVPAGVGTVQAFADWSVEP